ncbi:MAG: DUF2510 domain-containing protein [Acidimicrobiales bacterium]
MATTIIIAWLLCGLGGWAVGRTKGRAGLGAMLGVLLGLIGIAIVAFLPSRRPSAAGAVPWGYGRSPMPPAPLPAPPLSVPAQWAPDPSGRHEYRWWDGKGWSDFVSDGGVESIDVTTGAPGSAGPTS